MIFFNDGVERGEQEMERREEVKKDDLVKKGRRRKGARSG